MSESKTLSYSWSLFSAGAVALSLFAGSLSDLSATYGGVEDCTHVAGSRNVACDNGGACTDTHTDCSGDPGVHTVICDDEGGDVSAACLADTDCTNMNNHDQSTDRCRKNS
jgi:hypothetical protein